MHPFLHHKIFAVLTLLLWLFVSWSGAHEHRCFDGQEPPISVHMLMTGEHLSHHVDDQNGQQHLDSDLELSKTLVSKLVKIDLPLLLVVVLLLLAITSTKRFYWFYAVQHGRHRIGIRPPLRAPPAFPV